MRYLLAILLSFASFASVAQVNFVRNPDLEQYNTCPDQLNNLVYCDHWSNIIDTTSTDYYQPEYFNACGNKDSDGSGHIPINTYFFSVSSF